MQTIFMEEKWKDILLHRLRDNVDGGFPRDLIADRRRLPVAMSVPSRGGQRALKRELMAIGTAASQHCLAAAPIKAYSAP